MRALHKLLTWIFLLRIGNPVSCEFCQDDIPYQYAATPSMTEYAWNGKGEDPNRDFQLCPECSEAYTDEMEYRWAEYHGGLL